MTHKIQYLALVFVNRFISTQSEEQEGTTDFLEQLHKGTKGEDDDGQGGETSSSQTGSRGEEDTSEEEGAELSDLEEELRREKEIRLLYEQDSLLKQVCHRHQSR